MIAVIGGGPVGSYAAYLLAKKGHQVELFEEHKEIAGFIYAVIGAVYAVFLAFTTISVWEEFREAEDIADREANDVLDVAMLAEALPQEHRDPIRAALREYCTDVAGKEWEALRRGEAVPFLNPHMKTLMDEILRYEPRTEMQKIVGEKILDEQADLDDSRRERLLMARRRLPPVLRAARGTTPHAARPFWRVGWSKPWQ